MNRKHISLPPAGTRRGRCLRSALLWIPVCAALVTLIIELFNHKVAVNGLGDFLDFVRQGPLALLVNFLLVLITLTPALFLRRRSFYVTLAAAVWLIAGGVNGFILLKRMTPFTTADLTVLKTGLDTLPNYMSKGYIILLAAVLAVLCAALILLFWKGPRCRAGLRQRILTGVIALIVVGGALVGSWKAAFAADQLSTVFSNLAFAYDDYGFSYCFLQTWLNTGVHRPSGYGEKMMDKIRQEIENDTQEKTPQDDVNVIFVQLESFILPSEIKGLELSEDATPYWHELEQEYTTGYVTVPVVGAGTANTETEVLTGMSTRYFGPGEYPYKTCLNKKTMESLAYNLKALGYGTHAIHNHRATFYGRNQVYADLGFDDFTSLEFMPRVARTERNWAKDFILTSQIGAALDATENQPDLVFTVSVQGHGSYPTERVIEYPEVTVTQCPDTVNAYSLEYYVNQVHEMDLFVKELIESLEERGEKTVLVLYGDHLPAMNLSRTDMKSGSIYKTRYLIWDNIGLKREKKNMCSYELGSYVLGRLNITEGLLNQFHQFCRSEPSYLSDLKAIQYDVLYGQNYLGQSTALYEPTQMQMGIHDIQITGLYERMGNWYVKGENFSPYCRVTRDGKVLSTSYVSTSLLRLNEDPRTAEYRDLGIKVLDMHKEVLRTVPSLNEQEAAASAGS